MRIYLITASFFFLLGFIQAQNFALAIFNKAYTDCTLYYKDLEVQVKDDMRKSNFYLREGVPYTGQAKALLTDYNNQVREYIVSDIKDGYVIKSTYFYSNGTLSRLFHFQDGLPHGLHEMYHENGQKYIEENYDKGKKHGTIRRWTEKGEIGRDALYNQDIPVFDKEYIKDDRC